MHISDSYFDFEVIEREADPEAEQIATWETQYLAGQISADKYISYLSTYGDNMENVARLRIVESYKQGLTSAKDCLQTIKDFIKNNVSDYNFDTWVIPNEYAIHLYPFILPDSEDDEF